MAGQPGLLNARRIAAWTLFAALILAAPAAGRADRTPAATATDVVVRFDATTRPAERRAAVLAAGGIVVHDLHLIDGLGARISRNGAARLRRTAGVRAVTRSVTLRTTADGRFAAWNPAVLATAFVQATRTDKAWTDPNWPTTGANVGVAVIDTGIAGDLPDFRDSPSSRSRVIASVVTNPDATTATDRYGHGTLVAGLIAGNGRALAPSDTRYNRYIGTAPSANLISIKASDDHGNASTIDVIAGLQFAVDHRADYRIRVVNLSLGSSLAQSYRTDPLDAAVEAAWLHGIVVVAAAGNRGTDPDAVSYAPANDPYAITVGAVDDNGTKTTGDDTLAPWSSRGVTQDGFAKPDIVAPGAHIVAPLAPDSDYRSLCPTCIVDGRYFRVSGTSMAAPIVAGIAADLIAAHPTWTPNQVKGALTFTSEQVRSSGRPAGNTRLTSDGGREVAADKALNASNRELVSNGGLVPSSLIDPASGAIDPARAPFERASWKTASDALQAPWGAASWSCVCPPLASRSPAADPASWARASWKTFFAETAGE